jgi:hypothetical protein
VGPGRRVPKGGEPIRLPTAFLLCVLSSLLLAVQAWAHSGNPNYRSEIRALVPAVPGIDVEVLNYDDRLLLTNKSSRTVLVLGYEKEPYIRIDGDGTVQVNKRSPSFYLNEDRFAQVEVPAEANERAAPLWQTISKTGRYEWHDHRIHWMSKETPPQVTDKDKPTKISDWKVPIQVGDQKANLTGTLRWEPSDSSIPAGAFIALGGVALASLVLISTSRRMRRRKRPAKRGEAWG